MPSKFVTVVGMLGMITIIHLLAGLTSVLLRISRIIAWLCRIDWAAFADAGARAKPEGTF